MNFKELESTTKLRGGYYTPESVAGFLAKWVLAARPRSILEPSCGDGAFLSSLQGQCRHKVAVTAIELRPEEAAKARQRVRENALLSVDVLEADFLEWSSTALDEGREFDAVIGNPPYIRYQYLEVRDQSLAEAVFWRYQLPFTKHTNAWVPFVIASIGLLTPGGRLAMVIPSEVLHVLHAGALRRFLLAECDRVLLIDPNELLFTEALQGTVLLMTERKRNSSNPSKGVAVLAAPDNTFLAGDAELQFRSANYVSGEVLNGKWMKVLLEPDEREAFEHVGHLPTVRRFKDIATVDVGIVTGANKFFLVNAVTVARYNLEQFVRPMFGRSEHCPGVIYDQRVHHENERQGLPSNFVNFGSTPFDELPKGAREYIRLGEVEKLPARYKCRIRHPWYSVPSVYVTDVGMLKRSHHYPRLILNTAGACTTDTAYRIRSISTPARTLVYSFVNSLTALTAELEGRHYGGGVLELVPSEIEKLLVPMPEGASGDLSALDKAVRTGTRPECLLPTQDETVLAGAGIGKHERQLLHDAWHRIRSRRHRLLTGEPPVALEHV